MSRRTRQCHGGIHSPQMALYHAVHSYKGGLPIVAAMMSNTPSPDTLRKKLDPDQTTHHPRFDEAVEILGITKDPRILDALNAVVGATWFYPEQVPTAPADLDVLHSGTSLMDQAVRLISEFERALRDGEIDETERARIDACVMRVQQATQHVSITASRFEADGGES